MPLKREHPNHERGIRRGDPRCEHSDPILGVNTKTRLYYARCRRCLIAGPERSSEEAARKALLVLGAGAGSEALIRGTILR
jgi:hypothetical protein